MYEPADLIAGLSDQLAAAQEAIVGAVPSYLGLKLTVMKDRQPVVLQLRRDEAAEIVTSLSFPLSWLAHAGDTELIIYAGKAGSLVDLAADLAYALGPNKVVLDQHLPAPAATSILTGVHELSTVNRAVGILIEQGFEPAAALEELQARSMVTQQSVVRIAAELIGGQGR